MNQKYMIFLMTAFADRLGRQENNLGFDLFARDFQIQIAGGELYKLGQDEINFLVRTCKHINNIYSKAIVIDRNPTVTMESDVLIGSHHLWWTVEPTEVEGIIKSAVTCVLKAPPPP